MTRAEALHGVGLWLAGLAIGIKVILAGFAASPWNLPLEPGEDGLFPQIICTGSGFLVVQEGDDGEPQAITLAICPFYTMAASVILAEDPVLPLSLFFFTIVLAALAGLDRPRKIPPPTASFLGRGPPAAP